MKNHKYKIYDGFDYRIKTTIRQIYPLSKSKENKTAIFIFSFKFNFLIPPAHTPPTEHRQDINHNSINPLYLHTYIHNGHVT